MDSIQAWGEPKGKRRPEWRAASTAILAAHGAAACRQSLLATSAGPRCRLHRLVGPLVRLLARLLHNGLGEDYLRPEMLDRIDQQLGTLTKAANLRNYRQELLASNIANADTPNYKARDINFKAALDGAIAGRAGGALAMSRTAAAHLSGEGSAAPYGAQVLYRTEFQAAVDGNTVNMDVERSAFAENSVQVESALTFIREEFRRLQTAIQGQ
jgi:flagellar basal-body rod protein FlgB